MIIPINKKTEQCFERAELAGVLLVRVRAMVEVLSWKGGRK